MAHHIHTKPDWLQNLIYFDCSFPKHLQVVLLLLLAPLAMIGVLLCIIVFMLSGSAYDKKLVCSANQPTLIYRGKKANVFPRLRTKKGNI